MLGQVYEKLAEATHLTKKDVLALARTAEMTTGELLLVCLLLEVRDLLGGGVALESGNPPRRGNPNWGKK